MGTPTRTCPPPTPLKDLRVGDRVTYQARHMVEEREGRIRELRNGTVVVGGGDTINGGGAYIRVLEPAKKKSGQKLPPSARLLRRRFVLAVNETARSHPETGMRDIVEAVAAREEFLRLGGVGYSTYYAWRKQCGLPGPQRAAAKSAPKPEKPAETPARETPQRATAPAATDHDRKKAIYYAAKLLAARVREGASADDAYDEILRDKCWKRYGGPPAKEDVLTRAREMVYEFADAPVPDGARRAAPRTKDSGVPAGAPDGRSGAPDLQSLRTALAEYVQHVCSRGLVILDLDNDLVALLEANTETQP